MNLTSPSQVKNWCISNGFHPNKVLGQNFLIDLNARDAILDAGELAPGSRVLEIGPGIGPLTQQLCLAAQKVCAVELDNRLKPILDITVGEFNNLEIIWNDVLKLDVPALVKEKFAGLRPMACANLPYYITSPILTALLEAKCFDSITVMVQKEVALRMQASPSTKDYGALSLAIQYYSTTDIVANVPPNCFMPRPNVASAVINLERYEKPAVETDNVELMFELIRASFQQRRKTLWNGIKNSRNLMRYII